LTQGWDGSNWFNSVRITYEYNSNNDLEIITSESWEVNSWENYSRATNEFDANNNLIRTSVESWIGGSWGESERQDIYEYDNYNNRISRSFMVWLGSDWSNGFRHFYYYQLVSSVDESIPNAPIVSIFPNPNNGQVNINLGEYIIKEGRVNVYNSISQLVYSEVIPKKEISLSLDLSALNNGTYFLEIIDGNTKITESFLITK